MLECFGRVYVVGVFMCVCVCSCMCVVPYPFSFLLPLCVHVYECV